VTGRQALAVVLAAVAGLSAVGGTTAWLLRDRVIVRHAFADRALDALDRTAVRHAVEDQVAGQLLARLPAGVMSAQGVEDVVARALRTAAFRRALRSGAGDVGAALFSDDRADATLSVDVAAILTRLAPPLGAVLPAGEPLVLATVRSDELPVDTTRAADVVRALAAALPPLACFALAAALLVALDRRRAVVAAALTTLVCGALLLLGLTIGRSVVVAHVSGGVGLSGAEARAATRAIWEVYVGALRTAALVALAGGAVAALLATVPWGGQHFRLTRT
jgi:hypothetical protein